MGRGGASNAGPTLEDEAATEEEYPFPLTDVDRHNLSLSDEQFKPHTWEELKQIIGWLMHHEVTIDLTTSQRITS